MYRKVLEKYPHSLPPPTKSFPDGAPQREEYCSDEEYDDGCLEYFKELGIESP
jgi:hypothetical protein